MKNNRNSKHSHGKRPDDSFMFPDRDDMTEEDVRFNFPLDDEYDADGYDNIQDGYDDYDGSEYDAAGDGDGYYTDAYDGGPGAEGYGPGDYDSENYGPVGYDGRRAGGYGPGSGGGYDDQATGDYGPGPDGGYDSRRAGGYGPGPDGGYDSRDAGDYGPGPDGPGPDGPGPVGDDASDLSHMSRRERKAYEKHMEKAARKEEQARAQKGKNREILVVMYTFIFIFVATIGYFVYYNTALSKNIINHPGNIHIAKLQDHNTRGRILAADGSVLAQTLTDASGKESRNYPYANVFAHVVGTTGVNKGGLEAANEADMLISNANPFGKVINELKNAKNPGDDVVTTLDTNLQQVAYNALGNNDGVVIAIEPSTGKVLAMVSKPDYDPNTLAENYQDIISDPNSKVLLNQATGGTFTPGSIFKLCTTLEYIRENPNYSDYSYTCNGSIQLSDGHGGQQSISCYHNTIHGTQDLAGSFANSCNASFANIGLSLNVTKLNQLAKDMLFNQKLPTGIPHVKSSFSLDSTANDWLTGATAIGQGNTAMTPLHAAMLVSAVANGGVLMEPYLVDSIQNHDGGTVKKNMPKSYGGLMTTSEAAILTEMMKNTVNYGTASALSGMGYSIAGKTGTAEVDNAGNNAWFIGFAPAENPQIAVCVLVENSDTSSSYVSVPIAQQLFSAYVK